MILIDSNIWCYYFDESSKEHEAVVKSLEKALTSEKVLVNTVIIMELAHFLIKNLGPVIGKKKLQTFLEFPVIVVDFDYKQMKEALNLLYEYSHLGVGGRDATLLAAMKKAKTNTIITHDEAFKRLDWLSVKDPIS